MDSTPHRRSSSPSREPKDTEWDSQWPADDADAIGASAEDGGADAHETPFERALPVAARSALDRYARSVRAIRPIDAAEERELVERAQRGDEAARVRLIESHLGLVVIVAHGYSHMNMAVEDLIEEGNLGLMEAVGRFDPARGVRFATYARWWVREAITNAITTQSRTVRLPSHIVRGISSVIKAQRRVGNGSIGPTATTAAAGGADVSGAGLSGVAGVTGRSTASVAQLMALSHAPLSLDAATDANGETTLQDSLVGDARREPEAALLSKEMLATVLSLVDRLPGAERTVVVQRFGFGGGEARTLEEVGAAIDLTAERVRQLQVQALGRLREMLTSRGIDLAQFL